MIALFFVVSARGGGVSRAGLASLLNAVNPPLKVLDLVVLFLDKCYKVLVAQGEHGVV